MAEVYIGATYHHELKHISVIPLTDQGASVYRVRVIKFEDASFLWETNMDIITLHRYFKIDESCLHQIERQRKFSNDLEELVNG